jgi:hypothetical protein
MRDQPTANVECQVQRPKQRLRLFQIARSQLHFLSGNSSRESCCLSAEEAFLSGIAIAQQQKTRRGAA